MTQYRPLPGNAELKNRSKILYSALCEGELYLLIQDRVLFKDHKLFYQDKFFTGYASYPLVTCKQRLPIHCLCKPACILSGHRGVRVAAHFPLCYIIFFI